MSKDSVNEVVEVAETVVEVATKLTAAVIEASANSIPVPPGAVGKVFAEILDGLKFLK